MTFTKYNAKFVHILTKIDKNAKFVIVIYLVDICISNYKFIIMNINLCRFIIKYSFSLMQKIILEQYALPLTLEAIA